MILRNVLDRLIIVSYVHFHELLAPSTPIGIHRDILVNGRVDSSYRDLSLPWAIRHPIASWQSILPHLSNYVLRLLHIVVYAEVTHDLFSFALQRRLIRLLYHLDAIGSVLV